MTRGIACLAIALVSLLGASTTAGGPRRGIDRPKLAVVIVFDQLREDYLTRWQKLYGAGGLRRLMDDGAWFQNCHYPYAATVTATGHASIHTGCSPNVHGIVGNSWYDRATQRSVGSVDSPLHRRVPMRDSASASSPHRMLVPTLADALKTATGGKARVVSLSFKDRPAVVSGGKKADACYWFDAATGEFVTSTYYQSDPHPWIRKFNAGGDANRWVGKTWNRLRTDLDYERHSGPDDIAAEWTGYGQGRTFPHPMGRSTGKPGKQYYSALVNSPFGNELLLELAKEAVVAEKLGTRDVPDLLCVSFSANDVVGHSYGPDSQEVLDITLRTDHIVRDLLAFLDKRVGKGRYVLALTADHGVCPMPEVSRTKGKDAHRYSLGRIRRAAEKQMRAAIPSKTPLIEATSGADFYLNQRVLKALKIDSRRAESLLAGFLKKQPGVLTAYTRTQLLGKIPKTDKLGRQLQRSFFPGRSGDVVAVVKSYSLFTSRAAGTSHGSPHNYDTHVPLLFYGAGISASVHKSAVTPQSIAVVLADRLRIKPPAKAKADIPAELFPAGKRTSSR
jgi:predicted AlkP superfamily pyrophosphatase or phosphodiesterase